jgi:TolB-like protein
MKFLSFLIILITLGGCISQEYSSSQNSAVNLLQIDDALGMAGEKISFGLSDKTTIAIVNIASNEQRISEYIINELISAIVNHQKLTIVSRQKILDIQKELQFNMSGNISDDTAQRIGHMIGASSVVSGSLTRIANFYRLNIQVLKTETAEIQLAFGYDILNDSRIVGLTTNTNQISNVQNPLGSRGKEWNEQDGYAIVNGENYHYWLYSTEFFCTYHNWNEKIIGRSTNDRLSILHTALQKWVESDGWIIDYENAWLSDPNNNLAVSVKNLMASRGKVFGILNLDSVYMDVSVTIVTKNIKEATLIINYWNFMKEDYYRTWGYPLIKY